MIPKVIRKTWKDKRGHGLAARGRYVGRKAVATECRWIAGGFADGPEQMAATCKHHGRNAKTAFVHVVLSWREGEKPTTAQVFAAADHALERLGAQEHEAIFGIHEDTKNTHVHILFSRVHPISGKLLNLWDSFKSLELACREVEAIQGWAPDNSRFDTIIDRSGPVPTVTLQPKVAGHWALKQIRRMTATLPRQCEYDFSRGSGHLPLHLRLPERIIERIVDLCRKANDWTSLHAGLAQWGLVFRRTRRGAVIGIDGTRDQIAASHLAPDLGYLRLKKRLGDFVAAAHKLRVSPMGKPDIVLEGKPSEAAKRLLGLKWFAKDLPSRLHKMLTAHPSVADQISGLQMTVQATHLTLSDGGWVRDQGGKIHIGGGGSPLRKCRAAVLMAQMKGWAEVVWTGDTSLGARLTGIAEEMGMVGKGPSEIPVAPAFGLTFEYEELLQQRLRQTQKNLEVRRKRQEIRDIGLGRVAIAADKIESALGDLTPNRRRLMVRALQGAMRKNAIEKTDLRPAEVRLQPRDAQKETGRLLGDLRHQNPNLNHPALEFGSLDSLIGPLIARGPLGRLILGDLINLNEKVILLAHRSEGRICGYEYVVVDRTSPEMGNIRGSYMTTARLPTGGPNPEGEQTVRNLGEILKHSSLAMKGRITLISLGQAFQPASHLLQADVHDGDAHFDEPNEEGYAL